MGVDKLRVYEMGIQSGITLLGYLSFQSVSQLYICLFVRLRLYIPVNNSSTNQIKLFGQKLYEIWRTSQ